MRLPGHTQNTIPSLTALRAIACLMVFFAHAGMNGFFWRIGVTGQMGVMLFFSLSGFLMAYLYMECMGVREWIVYGLHRMLRIYPAYILVVMVSWLLTTQLDASFLEPMDTPRMIQHVFLNGRLGVLWTIPVEVRFYIFFPLIVILLRKLVPFKHLWPVLLCLLWILSTVIPVGVAFFLSGMWLGCLFSLHRERLRRYAGYFNLLFLTCIGMMFICTPHLFFALFGFMHKLWGNNFGFSLLMGLTVFAAANINGVLERLFSNQALQYLGNISFSFYLVHSPVLMTVRHALNGPGSLLICLSFIISIAIASFMYRYLEQPFRRGARVLGHKIGRYDKGVHGYVAIA